MGYFHWSLVDEGIGWMNPLSLERSNMSKLMWPFDWGYKACLRSVRTPLRAMMLYSSALIRTGPHRRLAGAAVSKKFR